jgi:cytochrome P450
VGDIYRLDIPGRHTWVVNRPDEIERILVHGQHFVKGGELYKAKALLGNGLLTSERELWKRQRRMMQPAFHRERVAAYGDRMVEITNTALAHWHPGEVRDVHKDSMALTLKIVCDTLFGDDEVPSEEVSQASDDVLRRFDGVIALLPEWLPFRRFTRYRNGITRLNEVVYAVVRRRRQERADQRGDLLSILLNAQDEDDGRRMSDMQLRDEVLTLLAAGHETIANALTWACHLVSQHPDAEKNLMDEVDALNGPATAHDLPKLQYTTAVLNESMRLFPPAWLIGREVVEPWEIAGFPAERGMQVTICPWIVQRDPRFFSDPLHFRPERWLDGSTESIPTYAYFPFGGGQRLCIGRPFAMLEGALVLATVARRFRLRPVDGYAPVPVPSLTLRPRNGLPMKVERR